MIDDGLFYRHLLDLLSDGIIFVDRNRRVTCANRTVFAITGYASDQLVGGDCWRFFDPIGGDGRRFSDAEHWPGGVKVIKSRSARSGSSPAGARQSPGSPYTGRSHREEEAKQKRFCTTSWGIASRYGYVLTRWKGEVLISTLWR